VEVRCRSIDTAHHEHDTKKNSLSYTPRRMVKHGAS
jgi:hypothetical protein